VATAIIRSSSLEFFRARAAEANADAEAATLDHVRERCHRSGAAWSALADKAERTERMRIAEAERKRQQVASETQTECISWTPATD
jgi:hypothetical protein